MPYEDSEIDAQSKKGMSYRDAATSGRPRFGFPDLAGSPETRDRLLSALMGFRSGIEMAQPGIAQGNPMAAALGGLAGGLTGPTPEQIYNQRESQAIELRQKQLMQLPIGQVAPGMAAKYDIHPDTPMAFMPVLAPVIQRAEQLEQQAVLARMSEAGKDKRQGADISAAKIKAIEARMAGGKFMDNLFREPHQLAQDFREYKALTGKSLPINWSDKRFKGYLNKGSDGGVYFTPVKGNMAGAIRIN